MEITKPKIRCQKYGTRAYFVFLNGEHWGNVIGYSNRQSSVIAWTAVWFAKTGYPWIPAGKVENRVTRTEAIKEISIQTAPDRTFR